MSAPWVAFDVYLSGQPGWMVSPATIGTNETFVSEAGREGKFALRDVEGCFGVAEWLIVQACDVFERRVAHRCMVTIEV